MVEWCVEPIRRVSEVHRFDVKEEPLLEVICNGTPNLDTQADSKAEAQASAVADFMGMASGQRVDRSTIVNKYLKSSDAGRGPTTSTWMCEKRHCGSGKEPIPDSMWRWILGD